MPDTPNYLATLGETLLKNSYQIVPIAPGEKYPANLKGWQSLPPPTMADLNGWLANGHARDGVGIRTDYTPAVDLDIHDARMAQELNDWIDEHIGLGKLRIGQAPKRLLVFKTNAPFTKIQSGEYWVGGQYWTNSRGQVKKLTCRVEILGAGQQFVAHHVHPETQTPYQWIDGDLLETPWQMLDDLTAEQGRAICARFDAMAAQMVVAGFWTMEHRAPASAGRDAIRGVTSSGSAALGIDPLDIKPPKPNVSVESVRALLNEPGIAARASDYKSWIDCGMALSHQFDRSDEGLELWREWSANAHNYLGDQELENKWNVDFRDNKTGRALTIAILDRWSKDDAQDVVKFRWDNLQAELGQAPDWDTIEPKLGHIKGFLKDNPAYLDKVAELLKPISGAPKRIDSIRKLIKPPAGGRSGPVAAFLDHGGTQTPAGGVLAAGGFEIDDKGKILSTQNNVVLALKRGVYGYFAFDLFLAQILVSVSGQAWTPLSDRHYPLILMELENLGFNDVSKEKIRDAVDIVAWERQFDSAINWANGLVWDGIPRIANFARDYLQIPESAYASAVSRYMWSAMAARALVPGIKVDMVPILISEEGLRKTTFVEALSPLDSAFGILDMSKKDDDITRLMRGKLILEWAELKGVKGKDEESVKQFFTQRVQEWIPKFKELATSYPRRCFVIGTANGLDILPSYGRARRWLPLHMDKPAMVEALVGARDQLWAEAIQLFRAHGIMWSEADALAPLERDRFREEDTVAQACDQWLNGASPDGRSIRGDVPFQLRELEAALQYSGIRNASPHRLGMALRALGYDKKNMRVGNEGKVSMNWYKLNLGL